MAKKGKSKHMKTRARNYIINGRDYGYGGWCDGYGGYDNYDDPYSLWYGNYNTRGVASASYETKSYTTNTTVRIDALDDKVENPTDALVRKMAAQRMKVYDTYKDALDDEGRPDDCYFPVKTGWGVLRTRYVDGNKVMFIDTAKECPLFAAAPRAVGIDIVNKIPKELLQEVFHSFFAVYKKYRKEAAAQIWRMKDGDRKYFVVYPAQKISGASVSFENNTEEMAKIREIADRVVDCHSHHSMGAFWSSVDDKDEQTADCFRMVMGAMSSATASYLLRIKYGEAYINFSATELFDMTEEEEKELFSTTTINVDEIKTDIFDHILDKDKAITTRTSSNTRKTISNEKFLAEIRNAPDKIMSQSAYSNKLWQYSTYHAGLKAHVACGYKFVSIVKSPDGTAYWERIDKSAKDTDAQAVDVQDADAQDESVTSVHEVDDASKVDEVHGVGETPEDVEEKVLASKRTLEYVTALSAVFCGGKVSSTETDPQPEGAKIVDYLCGCYSYDGDGTNIDAIDPDTTKLTLPGEVGIDNLVVNGSEFEPDDVDKITEIQAVARAKVQSNIEECVDFYGGTAAHISAELLNEGEQNYIEAVLKDFNETTFNKSFSPSVMWELLTNAEKCKLSSFFGITVVELGTAFGYATGYNFEENETLHYLTVLLLYKIILMPEDLTCGIMKTLEKDIIDTNNPHTIIINLNNYIKKTIVDKQE